MSYDEYARERDGVKVYLDKAGVVLGTAGNSYTGDYIHNEYRSIPDGGTRRDDLRGMSRHDLHAAGWQFIS